jgi:hypothetical protein
MCEDLLFWGSSAEFATAIANVEDEDNSFLLKLVNTYIIAILYHNPGNVTVSTRYRDGPRVDAPEVRDFLPER